tara:strand:- start:15 stop:215 length:201 start_codon:yes stop_codon:yes gene_type:complete
VKKEISLLSKRSLSTYSLESRKSELKEYFEFSDSDNDIDELIGSIASELNASEHVKDVQEEKKFEI